MERGLEEGPRRRKVKYGGPSGQTGQGEEAIVCRGRREGGKGKKEGGRKARKRGGEGTGYCADRYGAVKNTQERSTAWDKCYYCFLGN